MRGTQQFSITNVDDVVFLGPNGQPIGSANSNRDTTG